MDHTDADNVKPTEEYHKIHNVDESDILVGKLFSSRDQAWYFYKEFTREHGFSARRGTTRLDMEGNVKRQEFCCSKEGFRVSKVNTVDPVSKADIDEATTLKEVGVGTSQVMNYLTQQAWGYHNVGFTYKDLYNALQRGKTKEIIDGDMNALIAYFDYKKHDDPGFFVTYSVDESGALHNLIWSDSTSRSDYICFGDVIAFDTTCKDNLYGRPIMPIVGVNHHHNTIVFATAIITDETSQSFEAIKSVIPNAKHILCSWHLSRNAQANIGDPKFTAAFSRCMVSWWTTNEFDIQWRSVVSEFNVEKHPRVIEKGNTRHLWVQAYLTGHFFANIRSTQRWTKDAKPSVPSFVDLNVPPEIMQMARFASLRATTSMLCYAASKTDASFKIARDKMKRLTKEFENSFGLIDSVNRISILNNVRDPQRKQRKRKEVTKKKVEKKIRRCGFCNGEGHNKLTCPQVKLSLNTSTQPTSTDFFEDGMDWSFSPAHDVRDIWNNADNDLHIS
ncbi:hypothetical protein F3Y22_tig00110678pilonHSYRG00334 [Hibiscus syriacus]|uniref:MULE transposase domain-containing protein n=1 Tax=Hibiscus syriacus TaxID=106335 RepID=A0A6A2ZXM2_HIBSY|nr:hypothetical protein F3Y22_tig00110678pilonHSYRG00334 [Hibiscus syriacus]